MVGTGNETCDKLMNTDFNGNVIHSLWFKTIVKENGKADLVAINILADIVYWYRPTPVRDEESGKVIGYRKKFRADLLQRNYDSYADQFGLSKRQVTDAFCRLEKLGIIQRVFRTLNVNGMLINNVLHIDLNYDGLIKYSTEEIAVDTSIIPVPKKSDPYHEISGEGSRKNVIGLPKNSDRSPEKKGYLSRNNVTPITSNGETNTETITNITTKTLTENTTKNNNNIDMGAEAFQHDQEKEFVVVVDLLKAIGATEKKAVELVSAFGIAMVQEKLCILAQQKITTNPIGFIIQALRDNYQDAGAMLVEEQRKEREIVKTQNKRLAEKQNAEVQQAALGKVKHETNEVHDVNPIDDAQKKAAAFMNSFCLKYHVLLHKNPEDVDAELVRAKLTDIYLTGAYESALLGERLDVPNGALRIISDEYFKKYCASAQGLQHFLSDEIFSELVETCCGARNIAH